MSVRSASRGSPAARSIRLALRTSSIVATSSASFTRCVLRCFGRRCLSSALRLAAISVMPFIVRFQDPPRADALNHTPIRYVNNVLSELMDGKPPHYLQCTPVRRDTVIVVKFLFLFAIRPVESAALSEVGRFGQLTFADIDMISS